MTELELRAKALQEELDKLKVAIEAEKEPKFEVTGGWYIDVNGRIRKGNGINRHIKGFYNYYETEELAEQASEAIRKHNFIINFVLQFDGELGKGNYKTFKSDSGRWELTEIHNVSYNDVVLMSKECAEALCKLLNNGYEV